MIKENRTYDQVLGSIGKGDGDPALTLFDDDSAPNHRELARRFTLFDNFFADADVSADGPAGRFGGGERLHRQDVADHLLARRAPAPPRRDFENVSFAEQFLTEPLAFDRTIFRGAAALTRGYLWDNAWRDGVSFRDYGDVHAMPGDCRGGGNTSRLTQLDDRRFGDHVDEQYPGLQPRVLGPRGARSGVGAGVRRLRGAFRADPSKDPLPRADDHAAAQRPHLRHGAEHGDPGELLRRQRPRAGPARRARLAQPVLAQHGDPGTEDDAQNGPDHVDAHRTLGYVISPYTQTGEVDNTHYDTAGMVGDGREAAGPAADDDRRPARDADVEGLLAQAELPSLRRDDAGGDPVGAEGRPSTRRRAARHGVVAVELRRSRTRRRRSRSTRRSGSR